jgi:hypothetical protein
MKRVLYLIPLLALIAYPAGCAKKKGGPATGGTAVKGGETVPAFDTGQAEFRKAIKYISLTPDAKAATDAATAAEKSFREVATSWPQDAPRRFEGDNEWADRIKTLTKLMGDIKTQAQGGKTPEAEASILETQKLLLQLDEKNKVNTAGDEAIRLLVLEREMEVAFREKRYNDMKHIMPNIREAQKNFFGSTIPASARGREDTFDTAKDKVYEGVEKFAEGETAEVQSKALTDLIRATTEFYVEFG